MTPMIEENAVSLKHVIKQVYLDFCVLGIKKEDKVKTNCIYKISGANK